MDFIKPEPESDGDSHSVPSYSESQLYDMKEQDPLLIRFPVKTENENCMDVLKVEPSSGCETCLTSDDGNEVVDAKVLDVQEEEEEENPVPVSLPVIIDEHEVLTDLEQVRGPHNEICPASSHDACQAVSIKVEKLSDAEDEDDTAPVTMPGINLEPEVLTDLEQVCGPHNEICPASSHDACQAVSIKVEKLSDADDEDDSAPVTMPGINLEPEVLTDLEQVCGPHNEICPASSHDVCQAVSIKVEKLSDAEDEDDSAPVTMPGINLEPEVLTDLEQVCGPHNEICPASSHDACQAVSIKVEKLSDAEDEDDSAPVTMPGINLEPEVLTDLEQVCGPHNEICPASSHDACQAVSIKVEKLSDAEYEDDSAPVTMPGINLEPEVLTDLEQVRGPHNEICPASSHDACQAVSIKVEKLSDAEDEDDSAPVTMPGINLEPEVILHELPPEHVVEQPFGSHICNESFHHHSNQMKPPRMYSGKQLFRCDLCNKSFTRSYTLKVHKRIHNNDRCFRCTLCEKSFFEHSYLKRHLREHTGEQPLFSCDVCNKSFTRKYTLMGHQRIHSGERLFGCVMCNKSYCDQGTLNRHLYTHSGERPFCCALCNKSFGRKDVLKIHQRVHARHRKQMQ